jgi:hypothetical protein
MTPALVTALFIALWKTWSCNLRLTATQAFLVGVPVILGALVRIPMGMLTDRYGGRVAFTVLMLAAAIPPVWRDSQPVTTRCLLRRFALGWQALHSLCEWVSFRDGILRKSKELRSVSMDWATSGNRLLYSSVVFSRTRSAQRSIATTGHFHRL